MTYTGSQPSI